MVRSHTLPAAPATESSFVPNAILFTICAISLALRVILAWRGGQYFWTDESRYCLSQDAAQAILGGRFLSGIGMLFSSADHAFFKIVGVVPGFIEALTGKHPVIPAAFFSLFPCLNLLLLARIVRLHTGSAGFGVCAALVCALSNSLFYYSRHVFPYDLAISLILGAALVGLKDTPVRKLAAGVLSGLGFMAYNGYWPLGAVVLTLITLLPYRSVTRSTVSGVCAFVGFLLPLFGFILVGRMFGQDLVRSYLEFSKTVVGGDFGIAWRFTWQYFWSAEKGLLTFWISATAAALWFAVRRKAPSTVVVALICLCFYYGILVFFSDFVPRFTVFARHTRPLVLFFSVLGGWALWSLASTDPRRAAALTLFTALVAQAAVNFSRPLRIVFPPEFQTEALRLMTVAEGKERGLYRYIEGGFVDAEPAYHFTVIRKESHPLEFEPYTLDGYNEEVRTRFARRDFSMRVVRIVPDPNAPYPQLTSRSGPWAPYLGAVRINLSLQTLPLCSPEPLLSTGTGGHGDLLLVEYMGDQTVRFGVDHWGGDPAWSSPIRCDLTVPHVVIASFGSLYPEHDQSLFHEHPDWEILKQTVYVSFDGQDLILKRMEGYNVAPDTIIPFFNLIGFSSAGRTFCGHYSSFSGVDPSELSARLRKLLPRE